MYDLIILGGGPAGYYAAERAGEQGLSALLIEKDRLGGVCLNEGCIPSKTLLYSAKLFSQAKNSQNYGVSATGVSFDLAKVMARKEKIIATMRNGIASGLKKNNVALKSAMGRVLSRQEGVFRVQCGQEIMEGKRLLLCMGSEAVRLPIKGAERDFVYTNKEILSIGAVPKELVVIGAGVIGLEMASFFSEVGSRVTVMELLPHIAGGIDAEIGLLLKKELEKTGVAFRLEASVTEIGDHSVIVEAAGQTATVPADVVLMSVGRRPVTSGMGLENLGVSIEKSAISTDERGRTNVPGVWAAGDVNGVSMLAHTAYREAQVCIDDMCGTPSRMRYGAIPSVIYTHPEAAVVGLTLEEAKKQGFQAVSAKLPMSYNGRYYAENEGGRGLCKVVVDNATGKLLGVHMIGACCSEMIFGAAAMIEQGLTIAQIDAIVFPHPSVSEIIKDTLMLLRGVPQ